MTRKKSRKKGYVVQKTHEVMDSNGKKSKSLLEKSDREMQSACKLNGSSNGSDGNSTTIVATANTDSLTPVDVYARLTYPLVRSYVKDKSLNDYAQEEEYSIELKFSPRFYFAPNLCLICMERSKITCDRCEMVSYCSSRHKKEGLIKHRDLCGALAEIRRTMRNCRTLLSANHFRAYRVKCLEILESQISRPLELWEREIVLYPRACRICNGFPDTLKCCVHCTMDFFCDTHEKQHERWCREFQVFRRCLFLQHRGGHVDPIVPNRLEETPLCLPESLDHLFLRVYAGSPYYYEMDSYTYSTLSHVSTIPLTVLYSMQHAYSDWKGRCSFAIHVIGAEFQFECANLGNWEKFFIHFLPNLKRLTLSFVGPELRLPCGLPIDLLTNLNLCSECKSRGKTVNFSFHPQKLYHDVVRQGHFVESPDLICLFNPGLYRETAFEGRDTWPDTIREFCNYRVPVSVTSYTEEEIPRDVHRIRAISEAITLLHPRRNPYASLKPDRNFVSDDTAPLIYKNYYLTIVRGK